MLKLSSNSAEPFWLDVLFKTVKDETGKLIPGDAIQRTLVRPIEMSMVLAARAVASEAKQAAEEAGKGLHEAMGAFQEAFNVSLLQQAIVKWEGVGDENGEPIEPTPEHVKNYLSIWQVFDRINEAYIAPAMLKLNLDGDEKNASSGSPSGTSVAAPATATGA